MNINRNLWTNWSGMLELHVLTILGHTAINMSPSRAQMAPHFIYSEPALVGREQTRQQLTNSPLTNRIFFLTPFFSTKCFAPLFSISLWSNLLLIQKKMAYYHVSTFDMSGYFAPGDVRCPEDSNEGSPIYFIHPSNYLTKPNSDSEASFFSFSFVSLFLQGGAQIPSIKIDREKKRRAKKEKGVNSFELTVSKPPICIHLTCRRVLMQLPCRIEGL